MSAAYFIVLDNPNPGFDTFVNGKAIVADAPRLSTLCKEMNIKPPEAYFAMSAADAEAMSDEFDVDASNVEPEQWYDTDKGLTWVAALRGRIRSDPSTVKKAQAVLSDLAEFESVFQKAKAIDAKWHFSIDF